MNFKSMIEIFRGDDSDALGYQTIVGTIHTDLDLSGCKAVFRYLGFFQEFEPIPEDGKITIVIPSASSKTFPPGLGYASLRIYDVDRKVRTFTNRIPVLVSTMTPSCGCGKFDIRFSPFPELEPLKIFIGPNADDFDQYTGFVSKIIDRASLEKYGLAMLVDEMGNDGGDSGKAASPLAVKAAYDAIIKELTDNYYTADETDEAIDKLAAYYITYTAAGAAFPTRAALLNAETYYSGGAARTPTRNDYAVVLADETHDGAEYRYIYSVAEGQTTGSWEAQYPVGGVMTIDQAVTKNSANPVTSSGIWSAIWGALSVLPAGFTSLYDWCVSQLAGKASKSDVDSLLFAQYYPEGSVKSAAEFTPGIKYGSFDTTNRTVSVLPFCNIGDSENDNSNLSGRVVIPPFVDAQGNGYISDDGTRYKVVGVTSNSSFSTDVNTNLTAIIAPNTVTSIGNYAFDGCTSLTSVSLPTATSIDFAAFNSCPSLTSVSLPAVTSIGGFTFNSCPSLTSVSLPAVTSIGYLTFGSCTSLTSVSLPAVTNIGGAAFSNDYSLASVDFGATPRASVPTLGSDAFSSVPTSCKIIVPDAQYDAWTAASGWSDLVTDGYKFLKHSEWEYARKYEVDKKADKPATFTAGNLAALDAQGNPTDSGIAAGDLLTIVALTNSTETMASILARLNAINTAHKHVFFDCSGINVNPRLYLCTIMIDTDANAVRVYDQVTGKLYIGPYDATETIGEVFAKAVDAYHSITVSAVTLDGVTVTGQTVTIREGTDATAPVYATATITDGAPVTFVVPKGMIYFLEITDTLADHFGPRVTSGARQGIATADAAVTFTYYDAEHIDVSEITTFAKLQEALTWFGTNEAAARNNLVGIEIADTWTATNGTVYDNPRVVWDVHYFEDEDGVSHLGALMGTKYCSHNDVQFDAAEGEECDSATEAVAEADVYYYGLALGQTSKTAANLTLLELSAGDSLPYADYAKIYKSAIRDTTRNSLQYGYNNWRDSAYRQYLNSDAAAGQWWGATHIGDVAPSQLNSIRGFMAGCSAALLAAAKKVKVATWPNSVTDGPNQITTLYETLDTFFLPSGSEVYGDVNRNGGASVEGELSPYWQARTGYTAPNNAATSTRIIYRELPVSSTASRSAALVRLRSANRGNSSVVWYVTTSGQVYSYYTAYTACASVPACVIY